MKYTILIISLTMVKIGMNDGIGGTTTQTMEKDIFNTIFKKTPVLNDTVTV